MAFELCRQNEVRRSITNGTIPLFLGRDQFKPMHAIKTWDVMVKRPFSVGFFAFQNVYESPLSFIVDTPSESIIFFNVGHHNEVVPEASITDTIQFFNVAEALEYDMSLFEADGTIEFFNVAFAEDEAPVGESETILFFNVSEEEGCL